MQWLLLNTVHALSKPWVLLKKKQKRCDMSEYLENEFANKQLSIYHMPHKLSSKK